MLAHASRFAFWRCLVSMMAWTWNIKADVGVVPLQTSGNDIFYRNPYNVNENLFVDVSSPSSSNFSSVEDLGPPEAAAKRTLNQVGCHQ